MASDNLSLISYNVKEMQSSKRIKAFEYLEKRHTSPSRIKSNGVANLKEKYFTLMIEQILAVSQLLFLVQNI